MEKAILNFKIKELSVILVLRGSISEDEAVTIGIVHHFKTEKGDTSQLEEKTLEILEEDLKADRWCESRKEIRLCQKILYQPGFLEDVERRYEDYILPFAKRACWSYILAKRLFKLTK